MANLGEISFAGKIAYNIKNNDFKQTILNRLYVKYNVKIIERHFDKFEERKMSDINKFPYLISVRSNGNPYFLILTKINFINYSIFIDKKIQQGYYYPRMIIVNFHFNDVLFDDTVFDGEMVKIDDESKKWVYLINDIWVSKGNVLDNLNIVKRLNVIYDILEHDFNEDDHDISLLRVKKYFTFSEIKYFVDDYIPKLYYTCRGMYFKPLFLKFKDILFNFDDSLIKKVEKIKYGKNFIESTAGIHSTHDTIDKSLCENSPRIKNNVGHIKEFWTRKTSMPDVFEIFDQNMKLIGNPCIGSMSASKKLRLIFNNKNIIDRISLQYSWNDKFSKWQPVI